MLSKQIEDELGRIEYIMFDGEWVKKSDLTETDIERDLADRCPGYHSCDGNHYEFLFRLSEWKKIRSWVDGKGNVPSFLHFRYKLTDEQRASFRDAVFKRDNYTCQKCGAEGGKLNAHHMKPVSSYPSLSMNVDNGITLCEDCHRQIDDIHRSMMVA